MKWSAILLAAVVAAAAFSSGVWYGRKPSAKKTPTTANHTAAPPNLPASASQSIINERKGKFTITTLEQAQAGLRELERLPQMRRWEKLRDFARDIDPALLSFSSHWRKRCRPV